MNNSSLQLSSCKSWKIICGKETWSFRFRSGERKVFHTLRFQLPLVLFHPVAGQTPSFFAHDEWTQQSVSLWPTRWTQSVETARQHLDSSCDICFLLHLLQCHNDTAATITEWHSSAMNQPQQHFSHLTEGVQVKTIKLHCHLSFLPPSSSRSPQFTLFYFPLSLLSTFIVFLFIQISVHKLFSPKWNLQIVANDPPFKKMEKMKRK